MSEQRKIGAEGIRRLSAQGGVLMWFVLVLELIIALFLALLLLRSAFSHLGNPYYFLSTIYSYDLVGIVPGKWIAVCLPFLQIVVAACLLLRRWLKEAYVLAFLMFAVFSTAQTLTLLKGLKISCGCFGATESLQLGSKTLALSSFAGAAAIAGMLCTFLKDRSSFRQRSDVAMPQAFQ